MLTVVLQVAVELHHVRVLHHPQLRFERLDQTRVVSDHEDAAGELVQRVGEGLDRLHVEMVGGLVEEQHVRHGRADARKGDADLLSAGQRGDLLEVRLALQSEGTELGTRLELGLHATLDEVVDGVLLKRQLVDEMLRVASDAHLAALLDVALGRVQLAVEDLDERSLAASVRPDKRDPAVRPHGEVHSLLVLRTSEDPRAVVAVPELHLLALDDVRLTQSSRLLPRERHLVLLTLLGHVILVVALLREALLDLLQDLLLRQSLPRQLLLVVFPQLHVLVQGVVAQLHLLQEGLVVSAVLVELLVLNVDGVRADLLEERHVVTHHHQRLRLLLRVVVHRRQVRLEPDDGVQVKMVRGLVKQQHVRLHEHRARQGHTLPPPTRERRHLPVLPRAGEAETAEDLARLGLCLEGTHVVQLVLELLQAVKVLAGLAQLLRLRHVRDALLVRLDHDVDARLLEHVLIHLLLLLHEQHVQLLRHRQLAARKQLQHRRLAPPVRPDQPVPVPCDDLQRGVLEQLLARNRDRHAVEPDVTRVVLDVPLVLRHHDRVRRVTELAVGVDLAELLLELLALLTLLALFPRQATALLVRLAHAVVVGVAAAAAAAAALLRLLLLTLRLPLRLLRVPLRLLPLRLRPPPRHLLVLRVRLRLLRPRRLRLGLLRRRLLLRLLPRRRLLLRLLRRLRLRSLRARAASAS
eukprot:Rhum_TRINITY_DN14590_c23_g4::Rhum_TRINITY_DN14590_c23_g4_i1::g.101993::m.101993